MFFDAISNLQRHRVSCCSSVPGINNTLNFLSDIMTHLRDVRTWRRENRGVKLNSLLQIFRYRQATDPRDKVYGLLSLVTDWGNGTPIIPDYKSTTAYQVFTRSTAKVIEATRSLDVLCQHGNITLDYFSDLPSWVVDFSIPASAVGLTDHFDHQIPLYNASAGQLTNAHVIEDNILVLEGIAADRLGTVYDSMMVAYDEPQPKMIKQWYDDANQNGMIAPDWKADFWRVLCGDTVVDPTSNTYRRAKSAGDEMAFDIWCTGQGLGERRTAKRGSNV
jgi:hypothetical protein